MITKISALASVDASLGGTYFVLPGQTQYIWYSVAGNNASADILTAPSSALAVTAGVAKYLILPGKYYAWFQVNSVGTDPKLS